MKKTLMLVTATAVSGALSGGTLVQLGPAEIMPGLWFGLATAIVLVRAYRLELLRAILWLGMSVLSWYAAFWLYMTVADTDAGIGRMIGCGFVGALLLATAFYFIVRRDGAPAIPVTATVGALAAIGMYLIMEAAPGGPTEVYGIGFEHVSSFNSTLAIAFAVWQVTVALSLTSDFALRFWKRLKR